MRATGGALGVRVRGRHVAGGIGRILWRIERGRRPRGRAGDAVHGGPSQKKSQAATHEFSRSVSRTVGMVLSTCCVEGERLRGADRRAVSRSQAGTVTLLACSGARRECKPMKPTVTHSFVDQPTTYGGHRFPPEVISYAVWLYFRFPLSLRMVEEMLAARGIEATYETASLVGEVRARFRSTDSSDSASARRQVAPRRGRRDNQRQEALAVVRRQSAWCAALDVLVQSRRDKTAAKRLMRKPGGQPVHAVPPYPEGASQTRGARPGLCSLGKGALRADDGLPGFVRFRAGPGPRSRSPSTQPPASEYMSPR